jgi:hypothetical protein
MYYVCMYLCMYICMYVCMNMYVFARPGVCVSYIIQLELHIFMAYVEIRRHIST